MPKLKKKPVLTAKNKKTVSTSKATKTAKTAKTAKKKKVQPIPKGYNSITPYLFVDNAKKAITFYIKAFEAKAGYMMEHSDGKIGHAELKIGDTKIMLADECPKMNTKSAKSIGATPVAIHLYIKDVDAVIKRAVSKGAKVITPPQDMFYGDRCGTIEDPHGHIWCISTHIEDLTPAQTKKRAAALLAEKQK